MSFLGIVAALPREAACLTSRRLIAGTQTELGHGARLWLCGIGAQRAAGAAQALVDGGARALLSWGVAAGLCPSLEAGHLVLPEHVAGRNLEVYATHVRWHILLAELLGGRMPLSTGALGESAVLLRTPAQKRAFMERTGCVAADMESGAIARVAQSCDIPLMVIRAVVDPAHMKVPASGMAAMTEAGRFDALAFARAVVRSPGDLALLPGLARAFGRALDTLNSVARSVGPDFGAGVVTGQPAPDASARGV